MSRFAPYGYFGKLPHSGDFLRTGLSPGFVTIWDRWLQETLISARAELGEEVWLERYLTAPIWMFATSPGICGPKGAAGIVLPSMDRVGRRFPFCIAAEVCLPAVASLLSMQTVAEALDAVALSQLKDGATHNALDAALARVPPPAAIEGVKNLDPEAGSVWLTVARGSGRAMVCKALPFGPARATALFDLDAPFWDQPEAPRSTTAVRG